MYWRDGESCYAKTCLRHGFCFVSLFLVKTANIDTRKQHDTSVTGSTRFSKI